MSLPALFVHRFPLPIPYVSTLALQERIHAHQLETRRNSPSNHKDILLLLEHRPVYTAGRRQLPESTAIEKTRLSRLGADLVNTQRGGELTYHGPGQIVGYPLLDLSRWTPALSIRDYICFMQRMLKKRLRDGHNIQTAASAHTGVFLDSSTKVASIGVQVRHRLTSHGFAMNVTQEPTKWFDQVVACGLADVHAGSIEGASGKCLNVWEEMNELADDFGKEFGREIAPLDVDSEPEIGVAIRALEEEARQAGSWHSEPILS